MVYSVPPKQTKSRKRQPAAHLTETKAIVSLDDRRYVLDGPIAVARPLARVRLRAQRPQRLAPPRRAAARSDRRLADRRPRIDQRGQGQRPPGRRLAAASRRRGRRSAPSASPSTSSTSRTVRPWIPNRSRSPSSSASSPFSTCSCSGSRAAPCASCGARRAPAPEATGFHAVGPGGRAAATDAFLVAVHRRRPAARRALRPLRRALDRPLGRRRRADRRPLRLRDPRPALLARRLLLRRGHGLDQRHLPQRRAARRRGRALRPRRDQDRRHRVSLRARSCPGTAS